ncbi:hypothetical protein FE784_19900 [Paenibacillus hemerocallicola]|uniref:Uncharacterized protein n=1 Tax=Paenibacillus hemerocallicola TaxID=1172614 RepID=A0A5C4T645_9BACL|nr:hypothetical protein [Paenibacillus hemerocallicola]TNJ64543.1 hypothetical protein FE784_19900 [Paenibacillus hemerocallicola]
MKFTAVGKLGEVTYDNGSLSGSLDAVSSVQFLALALEGAAVGPVPAVTFTDHLKNPLSAKIIIELAFGQVRFSGNVPRIPRTPKGAIN